MSALVGQPVSVPDDIAQRVKVVRIVRGQLLFDIGQPHPYLHVVRRGCLKLVYRSVEGEEWVQDFVTEGAFFCSLTALQPGGVSSYACEALEDCELERIDYPWLESAAANHPLWQQGLLLGWKDFATRKETRERDLLTLTPAQRYQALAQARPQLLQRVPLKELARYLGITAVSLSRIRARSQPCAHPRSAAAP